MQLSSFFSEKWCYRIPRSNLQIESEWKKNPSQITLAQPKSWTKLPQKQEPLHPRKNNMDPKNHIVSNAGIDLKMVVSNKISFFLQGCIFRCKMLVFAGGVCPPKMGLASNITSLSSCKAWGFFDPAITHVTWNGREQIIQKKHKCSTAISQYKQRRSFFFGFFVRSIRFGFGTQNAQTWSARIVPSRKTDIYPNLGKFGKNHRLKSAPATKP